jgi:hypothetical protein
VIAHGLNARGGELVHRSSLSRGVWIAVMIMMPWIKNGNVRVFRAKEFTAPHASRATNRPC